MDRNRPIVRAGAADGDDDVLLTLPHWGVNGRSAGNAKR